MGHVCSNVARYFLASAERRAAGCCFVAADSPAACPRAGGWGRRAGPCWRALRTSRSAKRASNEFRWGIPIRHTGTRIRCAKGGIRERFCAHERCWGETSNSAPQDIRFALLSGLFRRRTCGSRAWVGRSLPGCKNLGRQRQPRGPGRGLLVQGHSRATAQRNALIRAGSRANVGWGEIVRQCGLEFGSL